MFSADVLSICAISGLGIPTVLVVAGSFMASQMTPSSLKSLSSRSWLARLAVRISCQVIPAVRGGRIPIAPCIHTEPVILTLKPISLSCEMPKTDST